MDGSGNRTRLPRAHGSLRQVLRRSHAEHQSKQASRSKFLRHAHAASHAHCMLSCLSLILKQQRRQAAATSRSASRATPRVAAPPMPLMPRGSATPSAPPLPTSPPTVPLAPTTSAPRAPVVEPPPPYSAADPSAILGGPKRGHRNNKKRRQDT